MDPQNTGQSGLPPQQPQQPPIQPPTTPPLSTAEPQPQPLQAVAPVPSYGGLPPQPGGGSKKGLIIGLIAGGVGLLVVVIVAVLLVVSMSVSKEDYTAAYEQYADVSSANRTLSGKVSLLQYGLNSGTDTSFNNDAEAARDATKDLKKENDELGELKAMKTGEGKEKYRAFSEKIEAYTKYVDEMVVSLKDARGAIGECSNTTVSPSKAVEVRAAVDACVTALEGIGSTPNGDIKEYANSLKDQYKNLSSIIVKLAAIKDPYGDQYDQYKTLRDQVYDIQDKVRAAGTDFRSNLGKHLGQVDPKDAADDLGEFLLEKATEDK